MISTCQSKWFYGLKAQSLAVAAFLVVVVFCVLFFYILPNQERWIKGELTHASERALGQLAASIVSPILSNQYAELYESLDAQLGEHHHWRRLKVSDSSGKQIYPLEVWPLKVSNDDIVILQDITFLEKKLGRIDLVANFHAEVAEGYRLLFTLTAVLLLALILVFCVVYYLINKTVIAPLRGLMNSFQALAKADYHSPLPRVFNNEIANVVSSFAEMRDDIERNQARLEILRKEAELANRAKSDFLSSMSHELRTPLNAILGLAQLFEYDDGASDLYKNHGKNIYNAGEYLLSLINDVLDLTLIESRNVSLNIERFSVADVVGECVNLVSPVASSQGISLFFTRAVPDEIIVAADYTRLKQSILNLLSNAIKYNCAAGMVTVSYLLSKGRVRICIDDTGKGLAQKQIDKLFTPFDRLGAELGATQGTGIGLVITKQLVELMGGVVGAESVLGLGSTFWIEMPLGEDESIPRRVLLESKAVATTPTKHAKSALRILVAEDNVVNQDVIRQQLALLGYTAKFAGDGLEAWNYIQAEQFDVLLSDIQMPELTGYELARQIRRAEQDSGARLRIVAITANVMESDIADSVANGIDNFIPKPIEINALRKVLESLEFNTLVETDGGEIMNNVGDLATETRPAAKIIEISQLVSMVGDDAQMHCMIFKSFTDTSPDNIQDILNAITARDSESVHLEAHKFKSSSRSMGAYALADTCAELESLAHVTSDNDSQPGVLSEAQWQELAVIAERMCSEYAAAENFIADYTQRHS